MSWFSVSDFVIKLAVIEVFTCTRCAWATGARCFRAYMDTLEMKCNEIRRPEPMCVGVTLTLLQIAVSKTLCNYCYAVMPEKYFPLKTPACPNWNPCILFRTCSEQASAFLRRIGVAYEQILRRRKPAQHGKWHLGVHSLQLHADAYAIRFHSFLPIFISEENWYIEICVKNTLHNTFHSS